nr:class I tRNA ligase family protein [Angustibacter aerolatus]
MLTNWYVRRSRERFWGEDDRSAFDTLYTTLEVLTRVCAPLLPLTTEEVWRGLTGGRSVHLADWPDAEQAAGRRRPGDRHGPRARGLLGGAGAAQGRAGAGAAAAAIGHGRGLRQRCAAAVRRPGGRRGERRRGAARGSRRLRRRPDQAARGQRPGRRTAARPRRAGRHPGEQAR